MRDAPKPRQTNCKRAWRKRRWRRQKRRGKEPGERAEDPRTRRRDSSFSVSREASGGREDERKEKLQEGEKETEKDREEERKRGGGEISQYIYAEATA